MARAFHPVEIGARQCQRQECRAQGHRQRRGAPLESGKMFSRERNHRRHRALRARPAIAGNKLLRRRSRRRQDVGREKTLPALAVQRLMGGEIVKTRTKGGTHFYNLIDGRYWDLAADQFDEPIPYENLPTSADEAFEHATPAQLDALLANIASAR